MSSSVKVIQPPNLLRAKVGTRFEGIDAGAIAKAEEALKNMESQFGKWLEDEVGKLDAAGGAIRAAGFTAETADGLYARAHDLKGLGTTYQFPLVTRLAGSLCRLLDDPRGRLATPVVLIDAHIDAIRAVVREGIQTDQHPTGRVLSETLEQKVAAFRAP